MDTTRPKIHQFAYCRRRLLALTYKSLVSAALHAVNNQPAGQLASWELKEKPGGKVGTWPPIIYQKYYQSVNRWNGLMNVQQGGGMARWQAYRSTKDRVSPLTGLLYMYVYGWGYDIGRGSGTQTDACIWLISENEEKSCRKRQDKVRQPSNGQNRNWITAGGPSFGQNGRMCLCVRGKSTYLFLLLDVGPFYACTLCGDELNLRVSSNLAKDWMPSLLKWKLGKKNTNWWKGGKHLRIWLSYPMAHIFPHTIFEKHLLACSIRISCQGNRNPLSGLK